MFNKALQTVQDKPQVDSLDIPFDADELKSLEDTKSPSQIAPQEESLKVLLEQDIHRSGGSGRMGRLAMGGAIALILLSNLVTCNRLSQLERRNSPTLVQLSNGNSVAAKQMPAEYRSPEVVTAFVKEWLPLAFNWDNKAAGGGTDEGQQVEGKPVPSDVWVSTFALSEPLRAGWLKTLVTDFELSAYMKDGYSRVLVIDMMGTPKNPEPGVYTVELVGNWIKFVESDHSGESFPWNKKITLQAVEVPLSPLGTNSAPLESAIYSVRSKGLVVTKLEDL